MFQVPTVLVLLVPYEKDSLTSKPSNGSRGLRMIAVPADGLSLIILGMFPGMGSKNPPPRNFIFPLEIGSVLIWDKFYFLGAFVD